MTTQLSPMFTQRRNSILIKMEPPVPCASGMHAASIASRIRRTRERCTNLIVGLVSCLQAA